MNLFGNRKKKDSEELQLCLKDEYGIEIYHEKKLLPVELEAKGYRKLPSEALGHVTQIFQYVPQLAVSHINNGAVQVAFKEAVEGTYRVILDPGTILAKSKQTAGAFRGTELNQVTNKVAGQAEFIENSATLSVSAAPQVALNIFNTVSFVTGQYFMAQVNKKLSDIKDGLNRIEQFLDADKQSKLKADFQTLEKVNNCIPSIKDDESQKNPTITQLKLIQTQTQGFINFYQKQAESVRQAADKKDKDKKIGEIINDIGNYMTQYRCATLAYCMANLMELYLIDTPDADYFKVVHEHLKGIVNQYKDDFSLCRDEMMLYLDSNNALNKRNPIQIAADVVAGVTLTVVTRTPFGVNAAQYVDEIFNEKRKENKKEKIESLKQYLEHLGDTELLDSSVNSISKYIAATKNTIELLKVGNDYYTNIPAE
ncbi:hypothetical protein EDD76_106195 [Kineothrix alysoides]|uniref:Uncharacterized protein n=1 Tax=Kineothrix alysoides TaxID=1469948 RepID=A0A4R1QZV8_9FIRM|nr:hypothetical protein [Kineothrix alysoides]TCL58542.1 hypothetical protein EDD76_106195 [Kineothrix alysoides]